MSPAGFEPTISTSERPQTYALDRAANESPWALNHLFKDANSIFIILLKSLKLELVNSNQYHLQVIFV